MLCKKLLCLCLCLALTVPAVSCIASAAGTQAHSNVVIYVHGSQDIFRYNEDGTKTMIFEDGDYLASLIPDVLPSALKGLTTGDWDEYNQMVLDKILPAFEDFAPAPDGTLPENTGIDWSWTPETLKPDMQADGLKIYVFRADTRLSPMVIADELNDFVEAVKQKNNVSRVNIWGRCEGTSLMSAYIMKYEAEKNYAGLENVIYIDGAMNGIGYMDALFSGNVTIPPDAAYRFLNSFDTSAIVGEDEDSSIARLVDFLMALADMMYENYSFRIVPDMLMRVYDQLKDDLIAKIVKAYFGLCLCHVSSVNEHFEDYVDYVFAEEGDKETYANVIALAREFHETVQVHMDELVTDMVKAGVYVNVVGEYGFQQYPLREDADLLGEHMTGLREQTFYPTVSTVDGTLSEKYIQSRVDMGLGKYISPDLQIDASTCLLPDNTYFVKNLDHTYDDLGLLLRTITNNPGATVDTNPLFGQFLNDKDGGLHPLERVNENDMVWGPAGDEDPTLTVAQKIGAFLVKVITWVRAFIEGIRSHANGTAG